MKKLVAVVMIASIVLAFYVLGSNHRPTSDIEVKYVHFDNDLPDALGKFELDADKIVVIVDASKKKLLKGLPSVMLVGNTVTVSSKSYFGVIPTKGGEGVVMTPHSPGEKVKLTANGPYTLLIFRSATDIQPIALTYIDKTDADEIRKARERKKESDAPLSSA